MNLSFIKSNLATHLLNFGAITLNAIAAYLSISTHGEVTHESQIVPYLNRGPSETALVAVAAAHSGVKPELIYGKSLNKMTLSPEDRNFVSVLDSIYTYNDAERETDSHAGINTSLNMLDDELRIRLGKVLIGQFSSLSNARQVQIALATLKEEDFLWLTRMGNAFSN